ncbi:hypothetical protein ACFE04_010602 [Oxalis oulophora]
MEEPQRSPDFDSKSRASVTPSLFNRSATMMHTKSIDEKVFINPTTLYRAGSMNKFYNSIGTVMSASNSIKGKVKQLKTLFEKPKSSSHQHNQQQLTKVKSLGPEIRAASLLNNSVSLSFNNAAIRLPGTEDRIVVYCTSLRGVRRTYEDCYAVMMIFRGFRVWVDERDVSMDSAYKKELQSVLGEKNPSLPQVFIRGRYVGSAEIVKYMFETGELARTLRGFPVRAPGIMCDSCGDMRFVPCDNCSGSRKLFVDGEDLPKRCPKCNENGLIRCPDCGS